MLQILAQKYARMKIMCTRCSLWVYLSESKCIREPGWKSRDLEVHGICYLKVEYQWICFRVICGCWAGVCLFAWELRCALGALPPPPPHKLDAGDWAGVHTVHRCHAPGTVRVTSCKGIRSRMHLVYQLADMWGVNLAFGQDVSSFVPCQHNAERGTNGYAGLISLSPFTGIPPWCSTSYAPSLHIV